MIPKMIRLYRVDVETYFVETQSSRYNDFSIIKDANWKVPIYFAVTFI